MASLGVTQGTQGSLGGPQETDPWGAPGIPVELNTQKLKNDDKTQAK